MSRPSGVPRLRGQRDPEETRKFFRPTPSMEPSEPTPERGRIAFGLPARPGWRGELWILGFFALCTLVLTWPIPVTLHHATGLRGDYFNNLWNVWWLGESLSQGRHPWHTDLLWYPEGLSLLRHTLSPINAALGVALSTVLGPHAMFNVVLLVNFFLAAWTFSLFARVLTGSTAGGVLGGMLYSFNPFHYYYLCQVNVFSLAWLPLALLFFVRVYREGGRRNVVLAALFTGCIAASSEYYVMYAVLTVGWMIAAGKLLDPSVPWARGTQRLLVTGALCGVVVTLVAAPLLYGTIWPVDAPAAVGVDNVQAKRSNDLFGYEWVGGPERLTVSWPTMLGYSTLLFLLPMARRIVRRQRFWVLVGAFFLVLSFGYELYVEREKTGIPLLYTVLEDVPLMDMLRKPDRAFLMVLLVASLAFAEAWSGLAERLQRTGPRRLAFGACLLLPMFELSGVPFHRFDYEVPTYYEELAQEDDVTAIVAGPPGRMDIENARYVFFQTVHGKKQPLGYCTILSKGERQVWLQTELVNTFWAYLAGAQHELGEEADKDFPTFVANKGFDRVVIHKTMPRQRPPKKELNDRTVWAPFFLVAEPLLEMRQVGLFLDRPIDRKTQTALDRLMRRAFGLPVYEDDDVVVYQPRRRDG